MHLTLLFNLDDIFGSRIALTDAAFKMKTAIGWFYIETNGAITLWDDQEYAVQIAVITVILTSKMKLFFQNV